MLRVTIFKKLGFALGVPCALAVTLELGLRLAGFEHPPVQYAQLILWNPAQDAALAGADDLHARDARTLWAPRPGGTVYWSSDEERVNVEGYRGPLRPAVRTDDNLRIVTLGDSSTFGLGVEYADTYSAQLEAELEARGRRAEVLDFGVIGFTVLQGVERYRERARHFHADVVVAAFGAVNEHWPVEDSNDADKLAKQHAQTTSWYRFAKRVRKQLRIAHLIAYLQLRADGGMQARHERYVRPKEAQAEIADRAGEVDWEGLRRVEVEEYRDGLEELRRAVESDGARLVLVSMPRRPIVERERPVLLEYTRATNEFADAHDLALCNAHSAFRAAAERAGPDELFLGSGDEADHWHPTARGHAMIASCLADVLLAPEGGTR
jgi:lysophospholipase L1-like esterase